MKIYEGYYGDELELYPALLLHHVPVKDNKKHLVHIRDNRIKEHHSCMIPMWEFFHMQNMMESNWEWETRDGLFICKGKIIHPCYLDFFLVDKRIPYSREEIKPKNIWR